MKKIALFLTFLFLATSTFAQKKKAYVIYNAKGKKVSYKRMIKKLAKKDLVFFGELHNNAIAHWLQLEVTQDLSTKRQLTLGAEMFEADNQIPLTNYLNGTVTKKGLDTLARLWPNYKTDYAPLVNFAKKNKINFIATNVPRRFASIVYKKGFGGLDALSANKKNWIAPLPIAFDSELPTYKNILKMMGEHGSPKLVMAQAIKDATMAHFILKNYKNGELFIHYNGAYHSDFYEGIGWYIKRGNATLNTGTITTVSQENVHKLMKKNYKKADFIICVDKDMTTTY